MEPRGYYDTPEDEEPEDDGYPVIPDEDPEQDDKEHDPASAADVHALKAAVAALEEANAAIQGEVHTLKKANAAFADQVDLLESDSVALMT